MKKPRKNYSTAPRLMTCFQNTMFLEGYGGKHYKAMRKGYTRAVYHLKALETPWGEQRG